MTVACIQLDLVTRFIDKIFLDIYRRVPTQIDWSILLKSFAFSALALRQDAYNTLPTLKVNIKLSSFKSFMVTCFLTKQVTQIKAWRCPTLTWGDPTLPSALFRFTTEFGMESGGSKTLWSPSKFFNSESRLSVLYTINRS